MEKCDNKSCNNSGTKLKHCTGCLQAKYCSKECQKGDWSSHKVICKTTNPSIGFCEMEVKKSKDKGIPICLLCDKVLFFCQCTRLGTDGIAYSMTDKPLTLEERDKNFKKWVKKLTAMKSKFGAAQFYKDFNSYIRIIMKVEEKLKDIMKVYVNGPYQNGLHGAMKEFPKMEMLVYGTVAVSKLVDCDFSHMAHFEAIVCYNMYTTLLPTDVSPSLSKDLQKVFDLINGIEIACKCTTNWPSA